jgi:hypothetical protein
MINVLPLHEPSFVDVDPDERNFREEVSLGRFLAPHYKNFLRVVLVYPVKLMILSHRKFDLMV